MKTAIAAGVPSQPYVMVRARIPAELEKIQMEKSDMSADYSLVLKTVLFKVARPLFMIVAGVVCAENADSESVKPGNAAGRMQLGGADLAVLELQQSRHDLPCTVTMSRPKLGFDFVFSAGYEVRVPTRELTGEGNDLTILFRVIPEDRPASYIAQTIHVAQLDEHSKRDIRFHGIFKLGEGKYHVDWFMRDRRERICSKSWDLKPKVNSRDSRLRQWIPQGLVQPAEPLFAAEPPFIRPQENGLSRYSLIVNLDPPDPSAVLIDDWQLYRVVAILRRMERDPRIKPCSIVVCSVETQQIVYQKENPASLDLAALGEALRSVKLGAVNAKRLVSTHGPAQFAADLIWERLMKVDPDALVVLGPKGSSEAGVSRRTLEAFDKPGKPAFYLSYDLGYDTELSPSRDPISSIIKSLHGFEYSINRPKDFFDAWSDVVARIVRTKPEPSATTDPTSR